MKKIKQKDKLQGFYKIQRKGWMYHRVKIILALKTFYQKLLKNKVNNKVQSKAHKKLIN